MTNKEKYKNFCSDNNDIPIFSKDWWLDSVCGKDNWDVLLVEKGGHISASMPYVLKKKAIFNMIVMPKLTQTLGVYIKYPKGQKYYKRLSWEKDMMTKIIKQLPEFDYFTQNFNTSITNWLPFYWNGFEQTTKYTYRIENIELDELDNKFETDIRRRRKKALQLGVEVVESDDIETFYELNTMTFKRKGIEIPYSFELVKKIFESCKKHNSVKMYFAKYDNQIIAVNFLVYDNNTVYYLMGGIDDTKKDLGGMDLILFDSIKYALENNKAFDFEGSMIENIEKYFRSFGAVQTPFFTITKINSRLLKLKNMFKEIIK
ncbi:GNAT family N-acetyltransferase [Sulfurimonas sp.]|uniref:GNAT family N-acetyltransferase n=1 Tax=Sulfurimonas sp. TaxID=2022749 RepID=UPI003567FCFB